MSISNVVPQQAVKVAQVTGPNTAKWKLGGGDLGCMWASRNGQIFHVFGDNFQTVQEPSPFSGPVGTDYRPNCLGRSTYVDFRGGVTFTGFNVDSNSDRTAILPIQSGVEDGVVPTGGIWMPTYPPNPSWAPNGLDVLSYVSFALHHTDQNVTRLGGTAYSIDGGKTWFRSNASWDNNAQYSDKFQQSTFGRVPGDPYIYRFMTESARSGNVHLARTQDPITKSTYQYWTGSTWSTNPADVGVLVQGPVGEMSVRYDDLLNVWMMLYHDDPGQNTVFRWAKTPTGPWSNKMTIWPDSAEQPDGVYAPMIHPLSSGTSLWFCGSDWNTYQTYLYYANLNVT